MSGSERRPLARVDSSLGDNPLSTVDEVLEDTFFRKEPVLTKGPPKVKPTHYKVISISLYQEDLSKLDEMVKTLKEMGHTKASRSQLIRFALDSVKLEGLPKGY